MPLPADTDATTPKYLRDKYAIVGRRRDHLHARLRQDHARDGHLGGAQRDAGRRPESRPTSTACCPTRATIPHRRPFLAGDLGIRLNFFMDVNGGGSSTEALIGIAIGVMEAGMCKCVAIFRSMNGYSQVRIGGTGARSAAPVEWRCAAQPRLWLAERRADASRRPSCATCTSTAPSPSRWRW